MPRLSLRGLVLAIALAEAILWLAMVANGLFAGTSGEARAINKDVALFATAAFAVTGAPALALAAHGRWLRTALALALLPLILLMVQMLVVV
jgi:hypothetical protein